MPLAILQRSKKGSDPVAAEYGPAAWRPLPSGAAPWSQIGVYGDSLLNQFPGYYNEPQLHSAVEWLQSGWYTPSESVLPNFMQTQQPTNVAGGQRTGATPGAPVGPITARGWAQRVMQSQVQQSGASALSWAANLSEG